MSHHRNSIQHHLAAIAEAWDRLGRNFGDRDRSAVNRQIDVVIQSASDYAEALRHFERSLASLQNDVEQLRKSDVE